MRPWTINRYQVRRGLRYFNMSLLLLFHDGVTVPTTTPPFAQQAEGNHTFLHFPTTSTIAIDPSTLLDVFIGDNAEIEYYFEEMRRRHLAIVLLQGEDMLLLPRKRIGVRCPFWQSAEENCSKPLDKRSPCYNTGWIGGYHSAMNLKVVFPPAEQMTVFSDAGVRKESKSRPWTIYTPKLQQRDILIRKYSGDRLEILTVNEVQFRGQVMHQEFDLRWVTRGEEEFIYDVPVLNP